MGKDFEGQQEMKDHVAGGQTSKVFSILVVDFHLQGGGAVCKFLQGNPCMHLLPGALRQSNEFSVSVFKPP